MAITGEGDFGLIGNYRRSTLCSRNRTFVSSLRTLDRQERREEPASQSGRIGGMQLAYEISPSDHLESVKIRTSRSLRRILLICMGACLLLLGIVTYPYFDHGFGATFIGLAIWIILISFLVPYIAHWRIYYGNRRLFGPRTVTFDETGVIADNPSGHLETQWDKFEGFRETKNLFLIYISRDAAALVPKRCFKATSQLDEFRSLLGRKLRRL